MRTLFVVVLLALGVVGQAYANEMVFEASVEMPMEEAYNRVYKALEDQRLWVVFEADIGKNLSGFAERWGEDYNQQGLESIRSMVFCNGWYANQVSNMDPSMLALCPQRLTLIHKGGKTTVLFVRPSLIAAGSPAQSVLKDLENEITGAITKALKQ
jgi:uncharacterized protein (DUF302 family)